MLSRFSEPTMDALVRRALTVARGRRRFRLHAYRAASALMRALMDDVTFKETLKDNLNGSRGWHITRKAMYANLAGKLAEHDRADWTCLAVSDSKFFGEILGLRQCTYVEANYPEHDLSALRFDDAAFDYCISDQVLEHVEGDPFAAVRESVRVVKPGGLVVHTTCFINEIHGVPKDFWRFTPEALALLCRTSGAEPLEVGGWGNREAWALIHAGFRTAPLPDEPGHPLYELAMRNEPQWPIVTWVVARRNAASG